MEEKYLTVEEAAALVHTHPETIRVWVRSGRLPAARIGRRILINAETLKGLLAEAAI